MPPRADSANLPIRRHIAAQLQTARCARRMSQDQLAAQIGVTFQQVQKYEKGSNRIAAERLFRIAAILQVPVSFFFDGLDTAATAGISAVSAPEHDLLDAFRTMPAPTRAAWLNIMRQAAANFTPVQDDEQVAA